MNRRGDYGLLLASLLLGIVLGLLPLPGVLVAWRPYWLALILGFWLLETPEQAGLGLAFGAGLMADLVFGTLLGDHALRLSILAFIVQRFRARLRYFPLGQQTAMIGALLYNDRLIAAAIGSLSGESWPGAGFWLAPLSGALLWPWLFLLLDHLRRLRRQHRA